MPTTKTLAFIPDEGQVDLVGNELVIYDLSVPPKSDPVAIRMRSRNGGIGKISIDMPSASGWTEVGYLFGKRDERAGMTDKAIWEVWQSGSTDAGAKKLFEIRHDEIIAHVRMTFKAGALGAEETTGPVQAPHVTRFYSDDGAFVFNIQGPASGQPRGRIVQYRVDPTIPESQWEVVATFQGTPA